MHMVRCERSEAVNGFEIWLGLANGILIAIPLWIILGIALALVFQFGPIEQAGSAALMIAAVCEAILLRPYMRSLWAGIRRHSDLRYLEPNSALWVQARAVVAPHPLFRQSLTLSALVGAYLQYYFLEVNLQIASLHPLIVFVPVASVT
jgi:hypothetical protein